MKLFDKCKMNNFLIKNLAIYIRDLTKILLESRILLVKVSIFIRFLILSLILDNSL